MSKATEAIERSRSHTEIVHMPYDPDVMPELVELADGYVIGDGDSEFWGCPEGTGGDSEFWGCPEGTGGDSEFWGCPEGTDGDSDKMVWRVHLARRPGEYDIRALREEAGSAGDLGQVAICDRALAGDDEARSECEEVILYTRREAATA